VERGWWLDTLLTMLTGIGLVVAPILYLITPLLDFADYPLPPSAGWGGAIVFAAAVWLLWRLLHGSLGVSPRSAERCETPHG